MRYKRLDPQSDRFHIVFFDGECPLCNRAVRAILSRDKKKQFKFAPLEGVSAEKLLYTKNFRYKDLDSLILLQKNGKIFIEGKGALRIFWYLGGVYRLFGWLSFLPSWLFDWGYRLVARHRYRLFSKKRSFPADSADRFLP